MSGINYEELEKQNDMAREEQRRRQKEYEDKLTEKLYISSLNAIKEHTMKMVFPGFTQIPTNSPDQLNSNNDQNENTNRLPTILSKDKSLPQMKRRDYLSEGQKKKISNNGEGDVYEVDYTGKMNYFNNQRYIKILYRFYNRKYGKFRFDKPPDVKIQEIEKLLMSNKNSLTVSARKSNRYVISDE